MSKQRLATLALVLGASLALSGCGSSGTSSTSEEVPDTAITQEALVGTWTLSGAAGPEGVIEDLPEGSLTIDADGAFGFDAQCNQFSGVMTAEDGVLMTGNGNETVQTLMFCDGTIGQVDDVASNVLGNLQSATLAIPDDGQETLTLVGENGNSLDFTRP